MQTASSQFTLRLLCLCVCLTLAATTLHAAEPGEIIVSLDERLLAHLETTAEHLAVTEKSDPTLKKDFEACNNDKKIAGSTGEALSVSIAARHPRMTAALVREGWKPGDFLLAYYTMVSMPMASEFSRGGVPDQDKSVRRNVAFYDQHKARVKAVIEKIGPLVGTTPAKG